MAIFKNNFKKILIIVEYVSTSTLDAGRWTLDAGLEVSTSNSQE